jgi:hypothetical protein
MSSVLGLKARPHIAEVRPARFSPNCATILSTSTCFWRSFTASTACSTRSSMPFSRPVWISAFTSFRTQLPP